MAETSYGNCRNLSVK